MRPRRASDALTWGGLNMDKELIGGAQTPTSYVRTRWSAAPAADLATGAVVDARHWSLIRKCLNSR